MNVKIHRPSPLETELLPVDDNIVLSLRPIQYQRSQRSLYVLPITVASDTGKLTDRAFLIVNSRTGRLTLEHRMDEVKPLVDEAVT